MQKAVPLFAVLLLVLAGGQTAAQVTVNPNALDQLNPPAKPTATPPKPTRKAPPPKRTATTHPAATTAHPPATTPHPPATAAARPQPAGPPAPPPAPPPVVPLAPPPLPMIPAPVAVPVRPSPPPPAPTLAADAPDAATLLPNGLRITFGADRSDLNPAADDALRTLAHATAKPGTTYTVLSFAAGSPEDASIARRLSLARALTVRSALIHTGIASEQIYVKALGTAAPATADGPADRTDILVGTTPQASAEVPSQPKPTP